MNIMNTTDRKFEAKLLREEAKTCIKHADEEFMDTQESRDWAAHLRGLAAEKKRKARDIERNKTI